MKFEWELITPSGMQRIYPKSSHSTFRCKVFGGWMLLTCTTYGSKCVKENLEFISDPKHDWTID